MPHEGSITNDLGSEGRFVGYGYYDEESQLARILKGECPHNKEWIYRGKHHADEVFECVSCGHYRFM